MKLLLQIIILILAVWLLVEIFQCDGTIPFCIGASIKSMFTGIASGLGLI